MSANECQKFQVNQQVVYPAHGVAAVEQIIEKSVANKKIRFYKLNFLYKDMTILIPVENCEHTGVRSLGTPASLDSSIKKFAHAVAEQNFVEIDVSPSGWNKRHKDYQLRIQNGRFDVVLAIYQELMYIAQTKDLSFGEKGLLHTIEELLAQELMVVKKLDRGLALETLRSPFKQFVVTYSTPTHANTL